MKDKEKYFGRYMIVDQIYARDGCRVSCGRGIKNYRLWVGMSITPKRGLVVGWRTLSSGVYSCASGYEYDYDPAYLTPTFQHTALMVVFNPRQNPVPVPLWAVY
jgi:hypothetical protein